MKLIVKGRVTCLGKVVILRRSLRAPRQNAKLRSRLVMNREVVDSYPPALDWKGAEGLVATCNRKDFKFSVCSGEDTLVSYTCPCGCCLRSRWPWRWPVGALQRDHNRWNWSPDPEAVSLIRYLALTTLERRLGYHYCHVKDRVTCLGKVVISRGSSKQNEAS